VFSNKSRRRAAAVDFKPSHFRSLTLLTSLCTEQLRFDGARQWLVSMQNTRPDKKLRAHHSIARRAHVASGITVLLLLGTVLSAEAPGDANSSTSSRARLLQAQLDHARAEQHYETC
jgi:hypothetical protein